ncbi:MAG TPA: hypothetical protein VH740_11855 [Vicinamibacterales bacterium]|jgi:hypothetical protein
MLPRIAAFILLAAFSIVVPSAQSAAPISAAPNGAPPPAAVAAPIASKLAKSGVRVTAAKGPVTLDFWWVESLPLKSGSSAVSWDDVEEGTLVGVVSLSAEFRDIRGKMLKPGIYTLRFGLQPENGDHLGVSPFRNFLLLSPAAADTNPAPTGHDGTIEISKTSIGGSHPGVWSIDPPVVKEAAALQAHKTSLKHDAVIVEVPTSRDGKPAGALRFGLVLVGVIEA